MFVKYGRDRYGSYLSCAPRQNGGSASVLPDLSPSLSVVLSIDVAEADFGPVQCE